MRRWLFLLWFALLLIPAAGLFGPWERSSEREARMLARAPTLPQSLDEWFTLPRKADAFVRDQFALRDPMIRMNAAIRESLNDEDGPDSRVVMGREGFLLLREGLAQSIGVEHSPQLAQRDGALICAMQQRLAAQNVRFIYAIAPSPAQIYPDIVPEWVGEPSGPTDYDSLIAAARSCGANALDLRPALRARRGAHQLYRRTDTHWTPRGALIAYNSIVGQLGAPELQIDAGRITWRTERQLGDLTRMLNAEDRTRERVETPNLAPLTLLEPTETTLPTPGDFQSSPAIFRVYPRDGLSVLLIGDSFGRAFFPDYLAPFVRRMSFIHHQRCAFDWRMIERAAPDIVIFMPTERYALCLEGVRPAGFAQND